MPNNSRELLGSAAHDQRYVERDGVGIICSERFLREPGLTHGFTTRRGGVSAPPFDTLNLGTTRSEPYSNIMRNYRKLCSAYGLEFNELSLVRHEHGVSILRLEGRDAGHGISREPFDFCDGLVTNDPSVTLVTCHADCSAFFVYDRVTRSIGLAHAGWKGMFGRIGQKLVRRLETEYGAEAKDMIAAIGPCICEKCFEVETELAESFAAEFDCPDIYSVSEQKPGKAYVSLRTAAVIQLMDAGVPISGISIMEHCTFEEKELFYSYRRDGKGTGSMAAFLRLDK